SRTSFFNQAVEATGSPESPDAKAYKKEVDDLQSRLDRAQADLDKVMADIRERQREKDSLERGLNQAQTGNKRLTDDLVRRARAAVTKQWGLGDWFRSLPVLDAFASPTKIHQFTLNDLTIDYNFKGVTRFDRCMTCHQGIDRAAYTKDRLRALLEV